VSITDRDRHAREAGAQGEHPTTYGRDERIAVNAASPAGRPEHANCRDLYIQSVAATNDSAGEPV
jgi:hypothetical protein